MLFLQNPDRPLTRDMILNSVGLRVFPNTRTVIHVVWCGQKLEPDRIRLEHFLTVHGVDIDLFRRMQETAEARLQVFTGFLVNGGQYGHVAEGVNGCLRGVLIVRTGEQRRHAGNCVVRNSMCPC